MIICQYLNTVGKRDTSSFIHSNGGCWRLSLPPEIFAESHPPFVRNASISTYSRLVRKKYATRPHGLFGLAKLLLELAIGGIRLGIMCFISAACSKFPEGIVAF